MQGVFAQHFNVIRNLLCCGIFGGGDPLVLAMKDLIGNCQSANHGADDQADEKLELLEEGQGAGPSYGYGAMGLSD